MWRAIEISYSLGYISEQNPAWIYDKNNDFEMNASSKRKPVQLTDHFKEM